MPRTRDTRIDVDVLAAPTDPRVQQQVVAAPVAVADPGLDDGFDGALLRGLSKMNPVLSAWADQENSVQRAAALERMQREEVAEVERGQAAAASGAVMAPEATRSYHDGYMLASGRRTAMMDTAPLREEWTKKKQTGELDENKFFTESLAANIKGINDPLYLKGYVGHFSQIEAQLRQEKLAEDKQAQRELAQENLGVASTRLATAPGTDEDIIADRQAFYVEQRNLGMAPDAIWDSYLAAFINQAESTGDITYLSKVAIPGPDGVHPALKPDRQAKLIDASRRILERQRLEASREIDATAAQIRATIDTAIEMDPKSLGDAMEIAAANSGPGPGKFLKTTEQTASLISRIQIAQMKAKDAAAVNALLDGPLGAAYAHTKEGQKALDERSNAVWDKVDPADEKSVLAAVDGSVRLWQSHTYHDKHLKGLFGVDTLAKGKDGALPAPFLLAARAYAQMEDANAHGLIEASMTPNQRAILANYQHNITQRAMTPDQAFDAAHKSMSVDAKTRTEVMKSDAFRKSIDSDLKDMQSRGIFSPLTSTSDFPASIKHTYEQDVRFNLESGMDPEKARDAAQKSIKERLVFTGAEYIVLPRSAEVVQHKQHIEAGLKGWVAEAALAPGNEGTSFTILASPDGQKYTLMRDNAPTDTVTLGSLVDAAKRQKFGSVEDKVAAVALNQRLVSGEVSPAEAFSLRGQLQDLRAKGFIGARRYEDLVRLGEKHIKDTAVEGAGRIREMRQNLGLEQLGPITDRDMAALAVPVKNPGGANPTAKAIALSALDKSKAPAAALTFASEGLHLKVGDDPNKRDKLIGAGYNLSVRKPEQVRSDLQKAGVAPGDVNAVLAGTMEITPDHAIRLTEIVLQREAMPQARSAFESKFGAGSFSKLPENYQAGLIYLAYNVGPAGVAKFPKAMAALHEGRLADAIAEMKTYNNGALLERAHTLMKGMLQGEHHFRALLNRGI